MKNIRGIAFQGRFQESGCNIGIVLTNFCDVRSIGAIEGGVSVSFIALRETGDSAREGRGYVVKTVAISVATATESTLATVTSTHS